MPEVTDKAIIKRIKSIEWPGNPAKQATKYVYIIELRDRNGVLLATAPDADTEAAARTFAKRAFGNQINILVQFVGA